MTPGTSRAAEGSAGAGWGVCGAGEPGRSPCLDHCVASRCPNVTHSWLITEEGEAEGKRHSWGVRPSEGEGARGGAGPSWDTRGVRRGAGVADGEGRGHFCYAVKGAGDGGGVGRQSAAGSSDRTADE